MRTSAFVLVFVFVFLITSQISTADVYKSIHNPKAQAFGDRVCTNKECTIIAARYLNHRNEKVDPCDDYGAHVCGNYKYHHNKQGGLPYEALSEVDFTLNKRLHRILTAPASPDEKPWHTLAKSFYQKCIDEPVITPAGKSAVLALLDEIGGWPLLNRQWNGIDISFEEYIADIHRKYGLGILFRFDVQPNEFNISAHYLVLTPAKIENEVPHLIQIAKDLDVENPSFVQEIYKFKDDIHERSIDLYSEPMKVPEIYGPLNLLAQNLTNFDLEKYVRRLFDGVVPVKPDMLIRIFSPEYFDKIHMFFKDKRVFANYAAGVVVSYLMHLPFHLTQEKKPSLHDAQCLTVLINDELVRPVAQMYAKEHINKDEIDLKLTEIFMNIVEVLADKINKASWLDNDTRRSALNKLSHMKYSFAYPEDLFDDTLISEKDVTPSEPSEHFIALASRLCRSRMRSYLAKMENPVDTKAWSRRPLSVNGANMIAENKVYFTAGILQPPLYFPNVPDYVTYATVGVIMGHEIMHGFDNSGRKYDEVGRERDWWTSETSQKFKDKTDCYVDQYNKEGINGKLGLGENIGDNIGMKLAYDAYKKHRANRGYAPEPALPRFEQSTVDEMFFLSYANVWCQGPDDEMANAQNDDEHPPGSTRIKIVAQNMKEFGEALRCPKKATMNPEKKCSLWSKCLVRGGSQDGIDLCIVQVKVSRSWRKPGWDRPVHCAGQSVSIVAEASMGSMCALCRSKCLVRGGSQDGMCRSKCLVRGGSQDGMCRSKCLVRGGSQDGIDVCIVQVKVSRSWRNPGWDRPVHCAGQSVSIVAKPRMGSTCALCRSKCLDRGESQDGIDLCIVQVKVSRSWRKPGWDRCVHCAGQSVSIVAEARMGSMSKCLDRGGSQDGIDVCTVQTKVMDLTRFVILA
uniref:Peptidase_M13 domain-containing protein n=1 Tax=Panagrellus redivivus TaxID=6233 RepID=A0A7E4W7V7_PANRE